MADSHPTAKRGRPRSRPARVCTFCQPEIAADVARQLASDLDAGAVARTYGRGVRAVMAHISHATNTEDLRAAVRQAVERGRYIPPSLVQVLRGSTDQRDATAYDTAIAKIAEDGGRQCAYHKQFKPRILASQRLRRKALRNEILSAYGGACACCGESEPEFLSIDHIDESGADHRRALGGKQGDTRRFSAGGEKTYKWLKDRGFPTDGFQLLCMNCNFAKGKLGECPHKLRRVE